MAAQQGGVSFDDIIQKGKTPLLTVYINFLQVANFWQGRAQKDKERLAHDILGQGRREKQRLANQIFGGGRSTTAQSNGSRRPASNSLASRVGVTKVKHYPKAMRGSKSLTGLQIS